MTLIKLERKEFTLNDENIKQEIDTQLLFILEIKLKNKHFLAKYHRFFSY